MSKKLNITSSGLHMIAMAFMFCDHIGKTLFPTAEWLVCIGRIAFPIFAFMIVEGYFHTHSLKNYIKRIAIGAVCSEIPFNLMVGKSFFLPSHQNVFWTFLIALLTITLLEMQKMYSRGSRAFISSCTVLLGVFFADICMTDYGGIGILTVLLFYFCRERTWFSRICQIIGMYLLNVCMFGGYSYPVQVLGYPIVIVQQGFAILSLLPIWMYQGQKGIRSKRFQHFCYFFYPAHMFLLYIAYQCKLP